jgi:predicted CXXCH cytochrome family protein
MSKRNQLIVVLAASGLLLSLACSANSRHRALSFFFDGVPEPGASGPAAPPVTGAQPPPAGVGPGAPAPSLQMFVHAPYRDNRCADCHDQNTGGMVRPLNEGLCLICHAEIVQIPRFLHGPVAVNDCTTCHHYHFANYEGLLIEQTNDLCLGCHDRDDMTTGEHHAALDTATCTDCHDPHGGDNPMFTRRKGP